MNKKIETDLNDLLIQTLGKRIERDEQKAFKKGYIDGYFDEKFFEGTIYEDVMSKYQKGLHIGAIERLENDKTEWLKEKEDFIRRIALFEKLNGQKTERNLSDEGQEMYNKYYNLNEIKLNSPDSVMLYESKKK